MQRCAIILGAPIALVTRARGGVWMRLSRVKIRAVARAIIELWRQTGELGALRHITLLRAEGGEDDE